MNMTALGKAIGWALVLECIGALLVMLGVVTGGAPPHGAGTFVGRSLLLLGMGLHLPSILFLPRDSAAIFWSILIQPAIWSFVLYFWFRRQERAKNGG